MKLLAIIFFLFTISASAQSLELINTVFDEQNPLLSPDGQRLYFTRAHHPQNTDGERDPGDIWFSVQQPDGTWSLPQHGGNIINTKGWNGIIGFNEAGTIMYLHHHYSEKGRPKTQGVAFSKRIGNEWSQPVNIAIQYFKNESTHQSGWISKDENILLISTQGYYTKGAEDLYVILRNADGTWREPINLGSTINSPYQEFSPYYDFKDSTLYYSSNGRGGLGSSDVFFSKRLDATWTNWAEPKALGDSINSQGKEIGFINYPDRNQALFSSTKNSDGYGDLKIHQYGKVPKAEATDLMLFIVNKRTGERISAEAVITNSFPLRKEITIAPSGYPLSDFSEGTLYITVSAPGYIEIEDDIFIGMDDQNIIIGLDPIEKGTRVILEDVLFELSKDKLLPQSFEELNKVVKLMKENPDLRIRLEGHTDTRGSAKANLRLSKARVEAVKDYLVSKGISKKRIEGKGFGGSQPLFTDDSEENRMKNRRVEFVIID